MCPEFKFSLSGYEINFPFWIKYHFRDIIAELNCLNSMLYMAIWERGDISHNHTERTS
jgi:hypothetical protein